MLGDFQVSCEGPRWNAADEISLGDLQQLRQQTKEKEKKNALMNSEWWSTWTKWLEGETATPADLDDHFQFADALEYQ